MKNQKSFPKRCPIYTTSVLLEIQMECVDLFFQCYHFFLFNTQAVVLSFNIIDNIHTHSHKLKPFSCKNVFKQNKKKKIINRLL